MIDNVNLASPAMARVIERRPDGSGVVEIPVAVNAPYLDGGKTETGKGPASFTTDHMREMVENFTSFPGPITVGAGSHIRDTSGPSAGFFDALELRGETMWARLDLGPALFDEVVNQRAWRGFSIEGVRDLEKPTRKFSGWVLTGGIFTNAPALDVHYQLAASSGTGSDDVVSIQLRLSVATEDMGMQDDKSISLASHEAKLNEVRAESANLKAELNAAKDALDKTKASFAAVNEKLTAATDENAKLASEKLTAQANANRYEAENKRLAAEIKAVQVSLNEAEAKVTEQETASLTAHVKAEIESAIEAGVPPAQFDGWEADPAEYAIANFSTKDVFDRHVTALRSLATKGSKVAVKSGHDPKTEATEDADRTAGFTAEERAALAAKGVNVGAIDFVGVTTSEEWKARVEAAKASTK